MNKENSKGFIAVGDTSAIIIDSGPEWGRDEWNVIKYNGRFDEERVVECFKQSHVKLINNIKAIDFDSLKNRHAAKRGLKVDVCWEDKRDCFERMELYLYWADKIVVGLNGEIFFRSVMSSSRKTMDFLFALKERDEMFSWLESDDIILDCSKMISERIKWYYIKS